jgi:hypothetical protein
MEATTFAVLARWTFLGIAAVFVVHASYRAVQACIRYRGKRLVTCTETGASAGVEVDAVHAGWTALLLRPELRVRRCTRWPEARKCGQVCLDQIESDPEGTLVRAIVSRWHRDANLRARGAPPS